jgi:5'-3' exonuclease
MDRLLIIDGNNLVHRVFYRGQQSNADDEFFHVYLLLICIKKYVSDFNPTKTICVWDEKLGNTPNKRKSEDENYKQNRDKEYSLRVHAQNDLIKELLQTLGIPSVFPQHYEADDVICILCNEYKDSYIQIMSADLDMCQLINETTEVVDPVRKRTFALHNFEELLKCKPDEFLTYKAINGDKSDNIAGIKGFGPKTIARYLAGEVELTPEQQEVLEHNLKLMTLKADGEDAEYVKQQLETISFDQNWKEFLQLVEANGFQQILNKREIWYSTLFQSKRLLDLLS